jgi:hypothetical protein
VRRYRYEIDNVRAHLRSLWVIIGVEMVIIMALWFGWSQAPDRLTIHVPPDLRSGADLTVDEIPPANVYAFAWPTSMPSPFTSFNSSIAGPRTVHETMARRFFGSLLMLRPAIGLT